MINGLGLLAATVMAVVSPQPAEKIAYGRAPSQYVEVYTPKGAGPFPVAVFIHGRCYVTANGGVPEARPALAALLARGVAVWAVEYRRVDEPGGAYPGMFQDVAAGVDRLAPEAPRLHLDLNHVALVGHSAGGHLALWASERANLAPGGPLPAASPVRVSKVVAIAPPGDLAPLRARADQICGPGVFDGVVGPPSARRTDPLSDTSPAALLPLRTPTTLIAGDKDEVVPPPLVALFAREAAAKGPAPEVIVRPGADHMGLIGRDDPAWTKTADLIAASLGR